VVQAALKLVLEPIFETDFSDSSYGFRPRGDPGCDRGHSIPRSSWYEWVFETDIAACFDEIDHTALMGRVRGRIGDKRVLALVKAFLKAGVLDTDGLTYAPSPELPRRHPVAALANIALSVIDDHFDTTWAATPTRRRVCVIVSAEERRIAWCATPTTSWSWCTAPVRTPRRCGSR